MLALSSDSGTVHLYGITNDEVNERESTLTQSGQTDLNNRKSRLGFLKKAIKYFDSEWSSLQLKVDEKIVFVNFDSDCSSVLVYKNTGKFWRYEFSKEAEKSKGKKKIELTEPYRLLRQS